MNAILEHVVASDGRKIAAQHLAPAEVGLKRIGHFGFFRRELCEALWQSHLLPELVTGR